MGLLKEGILKIKAEYLQRFRSYGLDNKVTRLKVVCTSKGGRNAKVFLSYAQPDT